MKKFFLICAALAGAVCLTLGLAACGESGGEETSAHEHNWSDEWTANEGYHWHECLAGGCTVTADSAKSGYAAHTDEDNDGYCDVCGYDIGVEGGNETVLSYITANFNQGENVIYTSAALDDLKTYLTVTGTNRDHSSAGTITGYTLSGELTAGTSTVTIAYNGLYTTFTVEVTAVELISISAAYEQGDTVIYPNTDMYEYYDDITVTGVNNDGSSCELEDGYEFDYDFTEGECEVTVYYLLADWNSGNFSYLTAAFTVNVSAVYIVGLAIEYYSFNDSEALYYAGVAWAGDSLADVYFDCVVSYNDDSYQYIGWDDEDGFELSLGNGTDILEEGENSITVTYNGYSETVTVVASVRSLDYSLNSDNASYTVTGLGSIINGDIVILATYNNFPVTAIGDMAFSENTILTSVTIPDSVISIGSHAFYNCTVLKSVTIGSNIESIGSDAFLECTSLEYNPYGNACYLGNSANLYVVLMCAEDTNITSCTINENTKMIYEYAFDQCTALESITMGNSVETICQYAFYGCSSLESITIPSSMTSIGDRAFMYCTGLKSITIPDSVETIGDYAFYNCTSLVSITIPDSVTSIGSCAFMDCIALESVTIGSGVTTIGSWGFRGCTALTEIHYNAVCALSTYDTYACVFFNAGQKENGITVYIGANVTSIPAYLFYPYDGSSYSPKLVNVEFAEGSVCESIGEYAFYNCTSLTSVTLGSSVTSIGSYAFYGCSDASIKAEGAITELGEYAFYNCAGLQSITLGEGLTSIGSYAFYNCTGLTEINYNATECADLSSNSSVFYNAGQSGTGITVYIGANVKSIPAYLFYPYSTSFYAPNIVSVEFATGSVCESIGNSAFSNCTSLTEITIPDSVISIGYSAFSGCRSLTSITIPENVTSIGGSAFSQCCKLVEVYNCSSLTITAGSSDNGGVAFYAPYVHSATEESKFTTTSEGYVFFEYQNVNTNTLIIYLVNYTGEETEITLPENYNGTTYAIYQYAFYNNTSITSVTISGSITAIGNYAFFNCTSLENVTIIGTNEISIGIYAFYVCTSLTSITIGSSVTSIGDSAFAACTSLTTVYYGGTAEEWSAITGSINGYLTTATKYYYSESEPTEEGNYWHYVEGEIVVWGDDE